MKPQEKLQTINANVSPHIIKSSCALSNLPENKQKLVIMDPNFPNHKSELQKEFELAEAEFKKVWPILVEDICSDPKFKDIQSSVDWLETVLNANVPQGKQTRAFLNIGMYRYLTPIRSEEEDFLNYVTGWMVEILQAAALIADDIMDASETRRGAPCWYKNKHVGITAINDAFLLENIAYTIAVKYFEHKDYFVPVLKLVFDHNLKTILGQSLDLRLSFENANNNNGYTCASIDFDKYDEETYKALVKYKTGYYTFCGPVTFALIRSGISDESILAQVELVTLKIGEFFQIQDDFLDCYGNPTITGKIGTDIKDGKLTWLIVQALKLASVEQRKILQESYGKSSYNNILNAENRVKEIYNDLELDELFHEYEEVERAEILSIIQKLPLDIPKEPFLNVMDLLYKRQK